MKKDWDRWVIREDKYPLAKDLRNETPVSLGDFSRFHPTMSFNREEYSDSQLDPEVARLDISDLLELHTKREFKRQRNKLKGKERDDWINFAKEIKENIDTEVEIHQLQSVLE